MEHESAEMLPSVLISGSTKHVPFWGGLNAFHLAEKGSFSEGIPSLTDQWGHRTGLCSQKQFVEAPHLDPAASAKTLTLFLEVMRPFGLNVEPSA